MRLGTVTLSTTLSALLLSGCSFIGGKPTQYENPYAKQKAAHYGQYGQSASGQHCQIATPRHPIPNGCRPEQVTIGVNSQYGTSGFSQQPQFGQPQYTDGAYGSAVGQTAAVAHHTSGPKKRKPKLRGSLSLGAQKNFSGSLIDYNERPDIDVLGVYDPQVYTAGPLTDTGPNDGVETSTYTANENFADDIYNPFTYESDSRPNISFEDAWSTPLSVKGGLEYIIDDKTTVFANGGYTYAEGNDDSTVSVTGTLYKDFIELDRDDGSVLAAGTGYIPNVKIATFSYDFTDLEQYDLEVGARRYLSPLVQSEGYRTVTPFVGASVGVAHVNATDITYGQRQIAYDVTYENLIEDEPAEWFTVAADNPGAHPALGTSTRISDAQWLPTGQLNVGAEWQITPGFALAAETGLQFQGARDYADFTNDAGETISGRKGDMNISVPVTLRGSINF